MQQTKKLIMAKQAMTQSASWLQSTPVHPVSQMQTPISSQTPWRLQILVTVGPPGQSMEQSLRRKAESHRHEPLATHSPLPLQGVA